MKYLDYGVFLYDGIGAVARPFSGQFPMVIPGSIITISSFGGVVFELKENAHSVFGSVVFENRNFKNKSFKKSFIFDKMNFQSKGAPDLMRHVNIYRNIARSALEQRYEGVPIKCLLKKGLQFINSSLAHQPDLSRSELYSLNSSIEAIRMATDEG